MDKGTAETQFNMKMFPEVDTGASGFTSPPVYTHQYNQVMNNPPGPLAPPYYNTPGVPQGGFQPPPQPPTQTITVAPVSSARSGWMPAGPLPPLNSKITWDSGLCGCFDDFESCVCGLCCPICFIAILSMEMGENVCGPFFSGPFFISSLRTKARIMYGVEGSICCDTCATLWCLFCVTTQIKRQMKISARQCVNRTPTVVTAQPGQQIQIIQ